MTSILESYLVAKNRVSLGSQISSNSHLGPSFSISWTASLCGVWNLFLAISRMAEPDLVKPATNVYTQGNTKVSSFDKDDSGLLSSFICRFVSPCLDIAILYWNIISSWLSCEKQDYMILRKMQEAGKGVVAWGGHLSSERFPVTILVWE